MNNKEVFSENLKFYMNKFGIDRNRLCDDLDFKYMTVSDWINAKTYPRIDKIEAIAHYFGINKSDLVEQKSEYSEYSIQTIYNQLSLTRQKIVYSVAEKQLDEQNNVVSLEAHKNKKNQQEDTTEDFLDGAVSAGSGEYLSDDRQELINIPTKIIPDADYDLILQVNGDSMEPMFEDHEYIFVKKTTEIRSGQIGVFIIDNESYLKKAYIEENRLRLVSLNTKYDDLIFDDVNNIKVIGTVVL